MGQAAILYPITYSEFKLLSDNPDLNLLPDIYDRGIEFDQNFEGIKFMLAQLVSDNDKELIEEIFYPS